MRIKINDDSEMVELLNVCCIYNGLEKEESIYANVNQIFLMFD